MNIYRPYRSATFGFHQHFSYHCSWNNADSLDKTGGYGQRRKGEKKSKND
ncbi:hypothetical protein HanRHA438_Chr04g0165321 [Helianthus annuus]|uniref:Uncharacterized protein n=1 Tax=Helianthus annuus TaxID=4232 RepID=A0A9K3J5Y4_HELAN|nr:hypothetical protein HanXRQr2_Chr04g0155151 [Helianthus annuus]KAJ0580288.1 hypothetical protein HanHA300_Chr04g0127541 [Helianthus annuus]KAJ0596233.1 hypothetical protein HanHA89_Chr04g0140471 [Helianthus annuus]KAJ0756894.1 hypothetical protein HanLR1_Chr04g0132311 [Helianthus annuus]KAJ0760629.1 hypothetical protein HanOQP8_Chr04g0140201 [Helianthus annuus]